MAGHRKGRLGVDLQLGAERVAILVGCAPERGVAGSAVRDPPNLQACCRSRRWDCGSALIGGCDILQFERGARTIDDELTDFDRGERNLNGQAQIAGQRAAVSGAAV